MRATSASAIAFLAISLCSISARASDGFSLGGDKCAAVNAPIVTFFFVDGCTSPFGVCTAGTVASGPLAGTTQFAVTSITPGDSLGVLLYTGELAITTALGVLSIKDSGALNGAEGTFFEFDEIVGGTGDLKGASGLLFADGISTPTGFDGTLSGQICGVPGGDPILD